MVKNGIIIHVGTPLIMHTVILDVARLIEEGTCYKMFR